MNPIEENEMEVDEISEIDTAELREAEVRQALKKKKRGKAPGIDGIPVELYKADSDPGNEVGKRADKTIQ